MPLTSEETVNWKLPLRRATPSSAMGLLIFSPHPPTYGVTLDSLIRNNSLHAGDWTQISQPHAQETPYLLYTLKTSTSYVFSFVCSHNVCQSEEISGYL